MTSYQQSNIDLVDWYFAAWNEANPEARESLIASTWTEDSRYVDPMVEGEGRQGNARMIGAVQQQFVGLKFRRTSDVDMHHDRVRFSWELAPEGGSAVVGEVDFGTVRDGLLQSVTGFIDFAPSGAKT